MAKIIRKKTRKNTSKVKKQTKKIIQNGFFNKIKLTESYTSLILGAIVVLIIGILFISFARGNKNLQTSSTKEGPNAENQKSQDSQTSSTYTIRPGDDLWTISENIYKDGYKWVEIAKLNNLDNPGLIYSGNKLIIPTTAPVEKTSLSIDTSPKPSDNVIENNSITGNEYAVVSGDNLWNIAVRAYGDGFKWPEIAKANNLANPSIIHSGNVFQIPR